MLVREKGLLYQKKATMTSCVISWILAYATNNDSTKCKASGSKAKQKAVSFITAPLIGVLIQLSSI